MHLLSLPSILKKSRPVDKPSCINWYGIQCISNFAVPILRKKYPDIERPYKVWFYPVSVIVTGVIFIGLFINGAIEDPVNGFLGFSVPLLGAVVYWIFDRKLKKEANEAK